MPAEIILPSYCDFSEDQLRSCLRPLDEADQPFPWKGHQAAVLVCLRRRTEGWELLLLKRSESLEHHAGQVGFPGGRRDGGDKSLLHTALRESEEELGIPSSSLELAGLLSPIHVWVSGHVVLPVVALLDPECKPLPLTIETESCWFQSLPELRGRARPSRHPERGGWEYPLPGVLLWGMSALAVSELLQRLARPA